VKPAEKTTSDCELIVGYLANRSGRVKYNIDHGKKLGFSAHKIQQKRGSNLFLVLHINFAETLWSAERRRGFDS